MKYKTVIKIVCDAYDADDAFNTAGEYLRGNVDANVIMKCSAVPLKNFFAKRYGLTFVLLLILVSMLVLRVTPIAG